MFTGACLHTLEVFHLVYIFLLPLHFSAFSRNLAEKAHHDEVVALLIDAEVKEAHFLQQSQHFSKLKKKGRKPGASPNVLLGEDNFDDEIDEDPDYEYPFEDE